MMQKAQPALQPSCTLRLARVRPSAAGVAAARRGTSVEGASGTGRADEPPGRAATRVAGPSAGGGGDAGASVSSARLVQLVRAARARAPTSTNRSFSALGTIRTLPGGTSGRPWLAMV